MFASDRLVKFTLLFLGIAACVRAISSASSGQLIKIATDPSLVKNLIVSTVDGGIHVLDAEDGSVQWSLDTGGNLVSSGGAFSQNVLFVPGIKGNLYAYESSSSSPSNLQNMKFSIQDVFHSCPFTTPEGNIVIAEKRSKAFIVDMETGRIRSAFESDKSVRPVCQSIPLFMQDTKSLIITRQDYNVRATDNHGRDLWNVSVAEFSCGNPRTDQVDLAVEDRFFAANRSIYAIDPFTRKILWVQELPAPPVTVFAMNPDSLTEYAVHPLATSVLGRELDETFVVVSMHRGQAFVRSVPIRIPFSIDPIAHELKSDKALSHWDSSIQPCLTTSTNFPSCLTGVHKIQDGSNLILFPTFSDDFSPVTQRHRTRLLPAHHGERNVLFEIVKGNKSTTRHPHFLQLLHLGIPPLSISFSVILTLAASVAVFFAAKTWRHMHTLAPSKSPKVQTREHKFLKHPAVGPPLVVSEIVIGGDSAIGATPPSSVVQPSSRETSYETTPIEIVPAVIPETSTAPSQSESSPTDEARDNLIGDETTMKIDESKMSAAQKRRARRKIQEERRELLATVAGQQIVTSEDVDDSFIRIGRLALPRDPKPIGWGSHGTLVFQGVLEPRRRVAVKRLLAEFYKIADQEMQLLIHSDEHPSVVRYFATETNGTFVYLALELCECSLVQLVESREWECGREELRLALRALLDGVSHLHSVGIVHRDLKPANLLVFTSHPLRLKISDMGLSKKLEADHSSFDTHSPGTLGWRAPELLRGQGERCSKSVDVFAMGCILYYTFTRGGHPFGDRVMREPNIIRGIVDVSAIGGDFFDAQDLILKMISDSPTQRPTAFAAKNHPCLWPDSTRLAFLCDASDRLEIDPPDSPLSLHIESLAPTVFHPHTFWTQAMDASLIDQVGTHRKYNNQSLRDLIRLIRNKRNHYRDLPTEAQEQLGPLPSGFLDFFTQKFPPLLVTTFVALQSHCPDDPFLRPYLFPN